MADIPRISNAEWEVMSVLWGAEEALGLAEIIERLPERQSKNPKTINTYLTRLTDKNVVSVRKIGRTHLYSSNVDRDACQRKQSRDFLKRVFQGATAPMMVSLIKEAELSDEEISRLQQILDQKKKGS